MTCAPSSATKSPMRGAYLVRGRGRGRVRGRSRVRARARVRVRFRLGLGLGLVRARVRVLAGPRVLNRLPSHVEPEAIEAPG